VTTDTVARAAPKQLKRQRRPLYDRCRQAGITHDMIAEEAHCTRGYVVHFFAGRRSPRAVELAIEKLLGPFPHLRRTT